MLANYVDTHHFFLSDALPGVLHYPLGSVTWPCVAREDLALMGSFY